MLSLPSSAAVRRLLFIPLVVFAIVVLTTAGATQRQRFYSDDPIAREPESQDASKATPYEIKSIYEMVSNLFVTSGYTPSGVRAKEINTIDEVPDSNWFTNRIGTMPITPEQLTRGGNVGAPPDPS